VQRCAPPLKCPATGAAHWELIAWELICGRVYWCTAGWSRLAAAAAELTPEAAQGGAQPRCLRALTRTTAATPQHSGRRWLPQGGSRRHGRQPQRARPPPQRRPPRLPQGRAPSVPPSPDKGSPQAPAARPVLQGGPRFIAKSGRSTICATKKGGVTCNGHTSANIPSSIRTWKSSAGGHR
jgi:hypothetical protein